VNHRTWEILAFVEDRFLNAFSLLVLPFEPLILYSMRIAIAAVLILIGDRASRSMGRSRARTRLVATGAWALGVP
jgi:hypothetical protein